MVRNMKGSREQITRAEAGLFPKARYHHPPNDALELEWMRNYFARQQQQLQKLKAMQSDVIYIRNMYGGKAPMAPKADSDSDDDSDDDSDEDDSDDDSDEDESQELCVGCDGPAECISELGPQCNACYNDLNAFEHADNHQAELLSARIAGRKAGVAARAR